MIDYIKFGKYIKKLRKSFNYTQLQVYELSGVAPSTQRRIEKGLTLISSDTLEKLSQLYKCDLFYILSKHREKTDLLSDYLINTISNLYRSRTSDGLSQKLKEDIEALESLFDNQEENTNKTTILSFLALLKDIGFLNIHFLESNEIAMEKLLTKLSRTNYLLKDPNLYSFELLISVCLATAYRKNNNFEASLKTLYKVRDFLYRQEHLSLIQQDYIGVISQAICYTLHRQSKYQEIISEIRELISNDRILLSRSTQNDLYYRLGITYHLLGQSQKAHTVIYSALLFESKERKKLIQNILSSQYDLNFDL